MFDPIVGNKRNVQVLRGLSANKSLLSCPSDGTTVDLWNTDDGSGRQEWEISLVAGFNDVYNIKVQGGVQGTCGGVSGNRVFLSCTSDGSKVDLYCEDDGSGRQRWQFVPVSRSKICNYYDIKVIGGVSGGCPGVPGNRVFLSCTDDGSKVDLWCADDDSGRQRWQLQ